MLNAETGEKIADIRLPGHPESFQLETAGSRIFVNVPSAREVCVVDRRRAAVISHWPLKDVRSNFPTALDEKNHRLFVGCRSPARLVVLDTESGGAVASLDCAGDADDLFYEPARRRVYLSGGEGRLDVFEQADPDHYRLISQTPTAGGARTSLLAPQSGSIYVAVPQGLLRGAEIRAFDAEVR
jgi:hypothetical protein